MQEPFDTDIKGTLIFLLYIIIVPFTVPIFALVFIISEITGLGKMKPYPFTIGQALDMVAELELEQSKEQNKELLRIANIGLSGQLKRVEKERIKRLRQQ